MSGSSGLGGLLAGTVALVTGAAQGMGAVHARRLAADGALVAVNDRVPGPALEALAQEIGGLLAVADLSDPSAVTAMVHDVEGRVGSIGVVVANHAAMTMGPFLGAENGADDEADWWRVVDTNLGGTFALVRAVVPGMRARGGGRIIIIASEWGVIGWPEATAYAASKAGLIALTKTLGRELAPDGILVNAVAPGVIDTPQLEVDAQSAGISLADMHSRYAAEIPLGRIGRPEEISEAVALLADPRLGSMVGQVLQVNGGSTRTRA